MSRMSTLPIPQVRALVELLRREDNQENLDLVRLKLLDLGHQAVPFLKENHGQASPLVQRRISSVLREIRWQSLQDQFASWANSPGEGDLESGIFLLARWGYPELDVPAYQRQFDDLAEEIHLQMSQLASAESIVDPMRVVRQGLFEIAGFHGNQVDYYNADNSYLNRVMDLRTGIPISLSVVILLVARRLELPVVGVSFPGHFMTRYEGNGREVYMDAFHGGRLMSREDCASFLAQEGHGFPEGHFPAATPAQILIRMMRNLIFVYQQQDQVEETRWLGHTIQIITRLKSDETP